MENKIRFPSTVFLIAITAGLNFAKANDLPESLNLLIQNHCADCHDDVTKKGGFDLFALDWDLNDPHLSSRWVKVYDQIASGEMPPKDKSKLKDAERQTVLADLAREIVSVQEANANKHGRSVSRRLNRFEYENILRDLLHDPHLKIADRIPLDGEVHGFAKVGTALDVSHVQVDAYLDVAEFALRRALDFPEKKPKPTSQRFYAREQGRMWAGGGNPAWARFSMALDGLEINDKASFVKRGLYSDEKEQPAGIVVDDTQAEFQGPWKKSTNRPNYVGKNYLANAKGKGEHSITWKAALTKPGLYEVRASFCGGNNLAKNATYAIRHAKGETPVVIDQGNEPSIEDLWFPLGRFRFEKNAEVSLSDKGANNWVIADAIQFVHVDDLDKKDNVASSEYEEASTAIFRGAYTPFYYGFEKFKAPGRGNYKFRFKARSVIRHTDYVDWEGKKPRFYPNLVLDASRKFPTPVNDRISPGKRSEPVKVYSSTLDEPNIQSMLPIGTFEAAPDAPEVYELEGFLEKGGMVKLDCMRLPSPMVPAMPHTIQKIDADGYPGVAFHWMEVEGPIVEEWPPASYRVLFGDLPFAVEKKHVFAKSDQPHQDARKLLSSFMEQAYRRPVKDVEFDRFYEYAKQLLQETDFTEAMLATYSAVLASPEFLFQCSQPGELHDFALAERLSLFLGESMPDQPLRELAQAGELRAPDTLRNEVDRLLAKPESDRFVREFLNSWLKLDEINDTDPDRELYPEYAGDWWLVNSMVKESQLFFADLIESNRPARNVIDSDYVFADERLAHHYGIPGEMGPTFRKVSLPENSPYGGILTQGAVLKVTANGTATSPVLRGVYVMEHLLGDPPSPPPPSVPAVEPDIRGAATIRELLAKHREDAACSSCHEKIDPPGFALESFDVMGRWRDNYRSLGEGAQRIEGIGRSGNEFVHYIGQNVDASGTTAEGDSFADINAFKKLLLEDEETIARNLVEQLVVYATGASVRFADRDEVASILKKARGSDYGVRTIIHEIVQSPLFLRK